MTKVVNARPAGDEHQVLEIHGDQGTYRRKPCSDCPWRKDAVGVFPAEAFKHSARTAEDMATHIFGCHQSGSDKPATCAGFLINGADHNLHVRFKRMQGEMLDVSADGIDLHKDYYDMAVANGVAPNDPALQNVRRAR